MSILDFIKRDPASRSLFRINLTGARNYDAVYFPQDISTADLPTLITLIESNEILRKLIKITICTSTRNMDKKIQYLCKGKFRKRYRKICKANGTMKAIRGSISSMINNQHLPTLKLVVEKLPELLYEPGSEESSKLIGSVFSNRNFSCRFDRIDQALQYLKDKGFVITSQAHISAHAGYGYGNSDTITKGLLFYGFTTQVTTRLVCNAIRRGRGSVPELKRLAQIGFDKDMTISTNSEALRWMNRRLNLHYQWRQQHPTVNLVEYTLLVYKASNINNSIKILQYLKEIGVNHQNTAFTRQLLDRCISMSKKRYPKHDRLEAAVYAFGGANIGGGGGEESGSASCESTSSFSSSE